MDRHSEVEVKYDATHVSLKSYKDFVESLPSSFKVEDFFIVKGTDTYYLIGNAPLRLRKDRNGGLEITYKKRKSKDNIYDRVEINLPFRETVHSTDVERLLGCVGAKESFSINKTSYIYRVCAVEKPQGKKGSIKYEAVIALYVVDSGDDLDRFLEIEIDASSKCSPKDGMEVLDKWKNLIQDKLNVGQPLNKSLYEMYSKGKKK